jgi:hypothetical protein
MLDEACRRRKWMRRAALAAVVGVVGALAIAAGVLAVKSPTWATGIGAAATVLGLTIPMVGAAIRRHDRRQRLAQPARPPGVRGVPGGRPPGRHDEDAPGPPNGGQGAPAERGRYRI